MKKKDWCAKHLHRLLFSALITSSTAAMADIYFPAPADQLNAESTCGTTIDWQPVETYDGSSWPSTGYVSTNESQVGRLVIHSSLGTGLCSGTMIAPDLFLTAGHCVEAGDTFQVEMNYQNMPNGTPRNVQRYNVTQVVEDELAGLDYAVLRVQGNPGRRYGMTTPVAQNVGVGTKLAIIQHPNGIRKVVAAGTAQRTYGSQLFYGDIDTSGGSSGSGVLNSQGNLIAVHTNAGCGANGGANQGVLIRDIARISPVLNELTSRVCQMKPIARYWNPTTKDHLYSPVFEPDGLWGYDFERYEYSLCKNSINGSVPYRQWWNPSIKDHYYTVDHSANVQSFLRSAGYNYEGVQGQVHTSSLNGSIPLRRYWNNSLKDHFYTIDNIADGTYGYAFERIEAHVFRQ